jgi:glutamine synthetase
MVDRDALEGWLDEHDIRVVRVDATGPEGTLIGKHVSRPKFLSCLPDGVAMTDIGLVMDLAGTPQLGWWADWRQDALGDVNVRPDLTTLIEIPDQPGVAWCLGTFAALSGRALPICPRSLLAKQVDDLAALGLEARTAIEVEFFVFEGRIDHARRRGFRGLVPLGGSAPKQGYMTQRAAEVTPFLRDATASLDAAGVPWEAFTDEAGPGQFELNIAPSDPVTSADRVTRAKQVLRDVAYAHDKCVTFMARPFADLGYGSGLHMHLSLWRDGQPAFRDEGTLRAWIAGYMETIDGATSLMNPTVNSFRRQIDFVAAPTTPTWGDDNKGAAVRAVHRADKLTRVEHRVAAGDANPYLVMAAALAGGISGLEEQLTPPEPVTGLPWGLPSDRPRLPHSLTTAAEALARDERLGARLGPVFVEHWVEGRRWEWLMFHTSGGDPDADGTTDWELRRYFEWV